MFKIGIIGTGRVGSAVATALKLKGYEITGVYSRTGLSAANLAEALDVSVMTKVEDILLSAEVIFLTTPDGELSKIASSLADSGRITAKHIFFHMSGALPLDVISCLRDKGAAIGYIHPLQAFASLEKAIINLPGSFFVMQTDNTAKDVALQIIHGLEGQLFPISTEDKTLYHLGACIASNYLVSLVHLTVSIYEQLGMTSEQAHKALIPLLRGTLANVEELGAVQALTGPVARGDIGTIEMHMEALRRITPLQAKAYKVLGHYTIKVALEKGTINQDQAQLLSDSFREGDSDVC